MQQESILYSDIAEKIIVIEFVNENKKIRQLYCLTRGKGFLLV